MGTIFAPPFFIRISSIARAQFIHPKINVFAGLILCRALSANTPYRQSE